MPRLERPDGVELHWEERGEGAAVVLVPHCFAHPSVFEPISDELARDHCVIRYHARGTGESTMRGPHDMETGAYDLVAVIEAAGGPAVAVGLGDASNRATRAAAARPDLLEAVVGPPPMSVETFQGTDAMAASGAVLDAMMEMIVTDYRGAIRSLITAGNPQMSEEEIRDRVQAQVAYCPQEAAIPLFRAWIADDADAWAREIGDRLWAIYSDGMGGPWFPPAGQITAIIRKHLPEAHTNELEDGIVSRPDLTAAVVRRITAGVDVESAR
jgi:pimeloyl-ACP methyl ester carboxylesterase